MDKLSGTVESLKSKIERLVSLHNALERENAGLLQEKQELEKKIEQKDAEIFKLEERNKQIKLAKSISDTNENSLDIKLRINELVREIDKCIALLNR